MAAVASNHRSEAPGGAETDQFAESGPSFTAVNGASTTPPAKSRSAPEPPKEAGDEPNPRPARPSSRQERQKSQSPSRQLHATSHVEREPSPAANPVGDRPSQTPHRRENSAESKNHYGSHPETPGSQPSRTANGSPKKRKRSYPDMAENPNGSAYHTHEMPPSSDRQRMYSTDNGRQPDMVSPIEPYARPEAYGRPDMGGPPDPYGRPEHVGHPDPYARPEHMHPSDPYPRPERVHQPELYPRPDRHPMVRNEYDSRGDPTLAPQREQPYYSEAGMVRDLQNYNAMPTRENYVSPEDEDENAQQYGDYGMNRSSQSAMDERKRRKRVFSNRTKTGCMTCRRRKKKCDEQHPECQYPHFIPCFCFRYAYPFSMLSITIIRDLDVLSFINFCHNPAISLPRFNTSQFVSSPFSHATIALVIYGITEYI